MYKIALSLLPLLLNSRSEKYSSPDNSLENSSKMADRIRDELRLFMGAIISVVLICGVFLISASMPLATISRGASEPKG